MHMSLNNNLSHSLKKQVKHKIHLNTIWAAKPVKLTQTENNVLIGTYL
jgi:hypothetical protein